MKKIQFVCLFLFMLFLLRTPPLAFGEYLNTGETAVYLFDFTYNTLQPTYLDWWLEWNMDGESQYNVLLQDKYNIIYQNTWASEASPLENEYVFGIENLDEVKYYSAFEVTSGGADLTSVQLELGDLSQTQVVSGERLYGDDIPNFIGNPVPVPATMLLLGSGLIGLAGFRRKFKKK